MAAMKGNPGLLYWRKAEMNAAEPRRDDDAAVVLRAFDELRAQHVLVKRRGGF